MGFFQSYVKIIKSRPQDFFAFSFLVLMAVSTFIHGTFFMLPILLEDQHLLIKALVGLLVPSWIFIGVIGNVVLCRTRKSSIEGKLLSHPIIRPPPQVPTTSNPSAGDGASVGNAYFNREQLELKERVKYLGQQFMNQPYGEAEPWHICAACEVYVPPRSWHCSFCNSCILRRDHHCIFTMCCIGEENHCNFLGLLLYIAMGSTIASVVYWTHALYYSNVVWWLYFVKAFMPMYTIFFDLSAANLLSGVNLLGMCASWSIFSYYLYLAFRGQTSADHSRSIRRSPPNGKTYAFSYLRNFLGPNPLLRIFFPFHPVIGFTSGVESFNQSRRQI